MKAMYTNKKKQQVVEMATLKVTNDVDLEVRSLKPGRRK
jgi:hypothetical protein